MTNDSATLEARLAFARAWTGGSPYYERMGISIDDLGEGRALLRLTVAAHHLNADGIVHGGVLPALADAAMGSAARTLHGEVAQLLTIESNLRYFKPASGGALLAEARVAKPGRRVAAMDVEIRDEAGAMLARGGGSFLIQWRD